MPPHRRSSRPPPRPDHARPPHRSAHHRPPLPSSAIAALIRPEKIEALLAPWVPDAEERAFVVRCIVGEGPLHHRGASYALLSLLGLLLEAAGPAPVTARPEGATVPVPMRLPPHLAPRDDGDHHFPLELPLTSLERLAPRGSPELQALVDCLTDGPPHHALANAAMVRLIDALLARLEASRGEGA
jgi:hypothetical protein